MSVAMSRAVFEKRAKNIAEMAQIAAAANQNEQLTRKRVEMCESILHRGLWGRLMWLLAGR
jgi:hypothetical protein